MVHINPGPQSSGPHGIFFFSLQEASRQPRAAWKQGICHRLLHNKQGFFRGYLGIMEKKLETTVWGQA